ncbi:MULTISPECIES: S-layer homology domain-containing protein [unclassified Sedimentibacter]|uniref:S-layer homology domain-containing protein n=1 Tax=unclassified Sedimentibacter TaxID=2649220 RepID=UPI0035A5DD87
MDNYSDADDISSWAKTSFDWACEAELVKGTTNTTLEPQGSATRAQVATILMRFCENII